MFYLSVPCSFLTFLFFFFFLEVLFSLHVRSNFAAVPAALCASQARGRTPSSHRTPPSRADLKQHPFVSAPRMLLVKDDVHPQDNIATSFVDYCEDCGAPSLETFLLGICVPESAKLRT